MYLAYYIYFSTLSLTAEYPDTWVNLFLHLSRSLKICAQVESGTIVAGYSAVALYSTTIFVDTQLNLTGPDNITILKDTDNIAILWCKILW